MNECALLLLYIDEEEMPQSKLMGRGLRFTWFQTRGEPYHLIGLLIC